MLYPLTTLLNILTTLVALFVGILIIYILIKLFDKTIKLTSVLTTSLIFFTASVFVYLILDLILLKSDLYSNLLKLLLGLVVNFIIFNFIFKKYFNFVLWKNMIIYVAMIILFPFLYICLFMIEMQILNLPIFAYETAQLQQQLFDPMPLPLKIISAIDYGVFGAPSAYLRNISVLIPVL